MKPFATIKTRSSQVELTTPVCATQPLAKYKFRQQSQQSDDAFVNLQVESQSHSHATSFLWPPKFMLRGLVALSATCAQLSRNTLRIPLPKPPIKRRLLKCSALLLLPLLGCYNLVIVTIGSKTAASTGQMQAPEVQCAALAQPAITGINGQIDVQAMKVCEAAVAAQKTIDRERKGGGAR